MLSIVDNSSIGAFYLNSGGLHLNKKVLGRLAINLKLKICKLWYELEPMNDDYGKEMSSENTSNFQDQKTLTYGFSTLDKVATEDEVVKSSLGSLKLRNVNRLIFGLISINSIRNRFELLFSFVSNNIDMLTSETKINNAFPPIQFCVPGYSVPSRFDSVGNGGTIMLYIKKIYLVEC